MIYFLSLHTRETISLTWNYRSRTFCIFDFRAELLHFYDRVDSQFSWQQKVESQKQKHKNNINKRETWFSLIQTCKRDGPNETEWKNFAQTSEHGERSEDERRKERKTQSLCCEALKHSLKQSTLFHSNLWYQNNNQRRTEWRENKG